jgi:pyruvate/2-oxoglutarate dehydrogenase complex dihydrolipoamide acyltransferase (E2) component
MFLPYVGNFDSVCVAAFALHVGDPIVRGAVVATIETEKATMDLPAPVSGTITAVFVAQGQLVSQGDPLVAISPKAVSVEDLSAELQLGRETVRLTESQDSAPADAARKLGWIVAQLRPVVSGVLEAHPQIGLLFDRSVPCVSATLRSRTLQVRSTLSWNVCLHRFERLDVASSIELPTMLAPVDHPGNSHVDHYTFAYAFDGEAALAYARWIGWAAGVLEREAHQ